MEHFTLIEKMPFPTNNIHKDVNRISDYVEGLEIQYKLANLVKAVTVGIENSKSDEKIKDKVSKRVNTNMMSLNSSRDKK